MKRRLLLIALLLLCAAASPAATATFNYTFANPACSATVTSNCISGFAVGTVGGATATFTPMATCPLPATTTGTVTGITCSFSGTAPLGPVTFAVVALATVSGSSLQSPLVPCGATVASCNETTLTVIPSSPSGVVIIFP